MELKRKAVLLVDDEEPVRRTVRLYLESLGVHVLEADGGPMALKLAINSPLRIAMLLTDVLLPYMNGRDLANKVAMYRPDIKVLFISGYPSEVLSHHGLCPTRAELLLKPFSRQELSEKVKSVMGAESDWKSLTMAGDGSVAGAA
jgi:two-component system, cell cycle sensor histidine kinase and response regulator CckA